MHSVVPCKVVLFSTRSIFFKVLYDMTSILELFTFIFLTFEQVKNNCSQHALRHKMLCRNLDQKLEKGVLFIKLCTNLCMWHLLAVKRENDARNQKGMCKTRGKCETVYSYIERHEHYLYMTGGKRQLTHILRGILHYLCVRLMVSLRPFTHILRGMNIIYV